MIQDSVSLIIANVLLFYLDSRVQFEALSLGGIQGVGFKGSESNATKLRPFSIPLSPLIQLLVPLVVGLVI